METIEKTVVSDALLLESFAPSEHVNQVMSELVRSVIDNEVHIERLSRSTVEDVRKVCSETESELEKYWAARIVSASHPLAMLQSFPYLDNYSELVRRELSLVAKSGKVINTSDSALVIGSGPLPLTAYYIYGQSGASVDQVDSSEHAVRLGATVSTALEMPTQFLQSTGQSVVLRKNYDLIVIAALAGNDALQKQAIINRVLPHLSSDGRIIIRSARGDRELLYPQISPAAITRVRLLAEYHPDDHIINSVLVYGK